MMPLMLQRTEFLLGLLACGPKLPGGWSCRRRCLAWTLFLLAPALAFAQTVTLNFKDADIRAVIGTVADITGKNFIVDPRVNGRVTIISSRPMNKDEVYQVFLSVLEVNGFAAVPAGNVTKIIPDANAKFNDIPTVNDENPGKGDEIVTRVIELDNVPAAQLVPILRPLASPQAHMAAFPQANMLVISDRAANTERLAEIIRRMDRPTTDDVEIIPLQHASAAELVRILNTLQQQSRTPDQTGGSRTTLIADERTNSILVSGDKADRLRIRATISHLDTPVEQGGGNTHVVYLRYAKAADLASVLTGVPVTPGGSDRLGGRGNTPSSAPTGGGDLGNDDEPRIPTQQPAASAAGAPAPVFIPSTGGIIGGGGGNAQNKVKVSIVADEATNSLVITATASEFRAIEAVIRQLDVRRAQVVVEAVIAEIAEDKARELGIQLRFVPGSLNGTGVFAGTDIPSGGTSINTLSANVGGGASPGTGFSLGIFDGVTTLANGTEILNLAALVRAVANDSDSNLLSTPSLVTMDNQEAEIVVGQNVPFVTGSQQTTGGLANPFQTIQREDIGVKLKIKPQINEGDALTLDIEQEVSSIAPGTTGASDIITNKRSIKTSVTVDDGKIVVLGGLIDDNLTTSVQKVPFLGDIPVLGALFRNTRSQLTKRNLMVFLHPVILRNVENATLVSNSKYNYFRAEQLQRAKEGVPLLPKAEPPLLPPPDQLLTLPPPFEDKDRVQALPRRQEKGGKLTPRQDETDKPAPPRDESKVKKENKKQETQARDGDIPWWYNTGIAR